MEGNGNIKIGQVVFYDGSHLSIKALYCGMAVNAREKNWSDWTAEPMLKKRERVKGVSGYFLGKIYPVLFSSNSFRNAYDFLCVTLFMKEMPACK